MEIIQYCRNMFMLYRVTKVHLIGDEGMDHNFKRLLVKAGTNSPNISQVPK